MTTRAPRVVVAKNAGPFTFDGTRSYLIGSRDVVVIDPGPDDPAHIDAVATEVAGAERVRILLTHGHRDHSGGARTLGERVGAAIWGPPLPDLVDHPVREGDRLSTDHGDLVALPTPGHTQDHLAFHWPAEETLFVGDHLLGHGETTWVGEYPGCVRDYLDSLARIRTLPLRVMYPAHGPPLLHPVEALDRFERHRRARIREVEQVLARIPGAGPEEVFAAVYGGGVPSQLEWAAKRSLEALVEFVRADRSEGGAPGDERERRDDR